MALYLPGNTTANVFTSENTIALAGQTDAAFMWRGSFSTATPPNSSFNVMFVNFGFYVYRVVSGSLKVQIRTTSSNTLIAIATVSADQEYTVFVKLTGGAVIEVYK